MGFGDDMLRFNGIGERITWAMNNNEKPTEAEKQKYYEIVKWAAENRMSAHHALDERPLGGSTADDFRARQPGDADRRICAGRLRI